MPKRNFAQGHKKVMVALQRGGGGGGMCAFLCVCFFLSLKSAMCANECSTIKLCSLGNDFY